MKGRKKPCVKSTRTPGDTKWTCIVSQEDRDCRPDDPGFAAASDRVRRIMDLQAMLGRAEQEALHREMVNIARIKVRKDLALGTYDGLCQGRGYTFSEILKEKADSEQWMFITISPPDGWQGGPAEYVQEANRIIYSRTYIRTGSVWVFEQRGKNPDELGKGMHIHIVCPRPPCPKGQKPKPPCEYARDLASSFCIEKTMVDVKARPVAIAKQYILGKKSTKREGTEDKAIKQEMDLLFREQNAIEPYYEK